jgi:hypothetical protein
MDLEPAAVRGTPLGCVVGFLALIPLAIAAAGGYGLWVWHNLPADKKRFGPPELLTSCVTGGLILGLVILGVAIWIHRSTDWSRNPKQ